MARLAVGAIEAQGWRCDTVANIQAWPFAPGYDVQCNDFSYAYRIEDQGGRWVVSLR